MYFLCCSVVKIKEVQIILTEFCLNSVENSSYKDQEQIYVLKCLSFLLLFSCFPQSTIKKGFNLLTQLYTVTENAGNVNDSNVDMNQSERHSNAEDYFQVKIFFIYIFFLIWPNFILQRIVKDEIENPWFLNIHFITYSFFCLFVCF